MKKALIIMLSLTLVLSLTASVEVEGSETSSVSPPLLNPGSAPSSEAGGSG